MNDIQLLIDKLVKFRDVRHWEQFHNTRDLALAILIEAAELNELFLWKTTEESELDYQNKVKEELADVLAFSLLLAGKHGFNVKGIVLNWIVPHPSQQVKGYHYYMQGFVEEFEKEPTLSLFSCAYCHNYSRTDGLI